VGADIIVESTASLPTARRPGRTSRAARRKVVISAPAKNVDATFVFKVNHEDYDAEQHNVVSNASCTTNCIIPLVKVLQENFGIQSGYMTTVHAYTNDQSLLDAAHKDPRRARSAPNNIVPTSTGAARTAGVIYPELQGKVDGMAMRVPVPDGSITDFVARLDTEVSADDVNAAFKQAADGDLSGVLEYSDAPIVSSDIVGNPASCIFDSRSPWRTATASRCSAGTTTSGATPTAPWTWCSTWEKICRKRFQASGVSHQVRPLVVRPHFVFAAAPRV
jgi:glyceraldehyde 3-phosphate dehydrogenase